MVFIFAVVGTTLAQVLVRVAILRCSVLSCPVIRGGRRGGLQIPTCCLESLLAASRILRECWRSGSEHHSSTARKIDCSDKRCCAESIREKTIPYIPSRVHCFPHSCLLLDRLSLNQCPPSSCHSSLPLFDVLFPRPALLPLLEFITPVP